MSQKLFWIILQSIVLTATAYFGLDYAFQWTSLPSQEIFWSGLGTTTLLTFIMRGYKFFLPEKK